MEARMIREISQLEKEIQKLRAENEKLARFFEIGRTIGYVRNVDQLIPLIMTKISESLNADRSTLFLVNWERMQLWTKFAEGLEDERISIELKMGLVGLSVFTRQLVNVTNACEDPRFNSKIDEISGFRTESLLAVPFFDKEGEVVGAMELLNKKTGFFAEEDEEKALRTAVALSEIDCMTHSGQEKAKALVRELRRSAECERSSLFLIDGEKSELCSIMAEGLQSQDIHLSLRLGIAGLVAVTAQELNVQDAYSDPRFDKAVDERTGYRTRCIMSVPVKNQYGDVLGVIEAMNKKGGTFNDSDMDLLKALSSVVAISIENAMLFHDQDRQFRSILEVLAASIDAKDPLTAGHSVNVTKYAVGIGRELGLGETEIDVLSVAALLHDYGKLGVDENVLRKSGKLTPEEYEHIKQHVVYTRNILDKMYFTRKYRGVPLIASSHHERLDGSGYIDELKGHEIPFMARIIAVADVFEAMTAKRLYREALRPEDAFEVLEQAVGTKFDTNIVAALKRYWYRHHSN